MSTRERLVGLVVLALVGGAWPVAPAGAQGAEYRVAGTVRTAHGAPVAGATIVATAAPSPEAHASTSTDAQGTWAILVPPGRVTITVAHQDYMTFARHLVVAADTTGIDIELSVTPRFAEDVVVAAVRAPADTPVTKRDITRDEIERLNHGQEMPFLLERVPSLTQYSDSGAETGYSYLSLRGIPQTRMNITLDGVPLNEPEDSTFYFANFGDFASAIESIQVQRGVGTSTVGSASFVGSVNFASVDFSDTPSFGARVGGGAFGTVRTNLTAHSGALAGGLTLYGHAAYQETDGYRRHAGSVQRAAYFGASRQGAASFFKVFGFAGQAENQLAFLASDPDQLARDRRANPMAADERDDFGQRFVQAQFHRALGPSSEFSLQGYYNGADGWYRIRDTRAAPGGLFQYGLDWRAVGATTTLTRRTGSTSFTWGAHVNDFDSRHTREVVGGRKDYANRGYKNEVNTFVKLGHDTGRWHHYADAQLRWARFAFEGDLDLGSVSWTFFNPKVGTRVGLGAGVSVYGSIGTAEREPGRADMLSGEDNPTLPYDLEAVDPERVFNVEAGLDLVRPGFSASANLYLMEFRDEIAAAGELSEIGLPMRRNVGRSARRGLELEYAWQIRPAVTVRQSATFAFNRIATWTQFYDVYDVDGAYVDSTSLVHRDVPPLLSPGLLATLSLEYRATPWASLAASGRYVGRTHLDNTGDDAFRTPEFFLLDASVDLDLGRVLPWLAAASPRLRIQGENLLDERRALPSGYSYRYITRSADGSDTRGGIPYYYPLATRSVVAVLDLSF